MRGLSSDAPAAAAARDAGEGFTPGIVAPTELVLREPGIGNRQLALERFGRALRARPEVAAVIGAALPALPKRARVAFRSPDGGAVPLLHRSTPSPVFLGGIDDIRRLEGAVPGLLDRAGLPRAQPVFAATRRWPPRRRTWIAHDLLYVGLAAMFVNVLLLAAFLRSLVAPVLLVGASLLGIAATLGPDRALRASRARDSGHDLLRPARRRRAAALARNGLQPLHRRPDLAGGGPARSRPRRSAPPFPRASRAISIAALALAGSFATLAIIPIDPFRSFAFAVCAGVIIDAFLVRTVMIPALLAVAGEWSWSALPALRRGLAPPV